MISAASTRAMRRGRERARGSRPGQKRAMTSRAYPPSSNGIVVVMQLMRVTSGFVMVIHPRQRMAAASGSGRL